MKVIAESFPLMSECSGMGESMVSNVLHKCVSGSIRDKDLFLGREVNIFVIMFYIQKLSALLFAT